MGDGDVYLSSNLYNNNKSFLKNINKTRKVTIETEKLFKPN